MPALGSTRKYFSDLVKAWGLIEGERFINFYFARVPVKGSTTISPLGTPLVYNPATDAFNVYIAQDIDPTSETYVHTEDSTLPGGVGLAVTVGTKEGLGFNEADVVLSSTAVEMTVLFQGPAELCENHMEWGTADATAQASFRRQIAKQEIQFETQATVVAPYFVDEG
jgi:hypothetical protein